MKGNKKFGILSILLVFCLVTALLPAAAFAATATRPGNVPTNGPLYNPAPLVPQVNMETDVTVVKVWDCAKEQIPDSVEVILICVENDDPREVGSAILSEANDWSHTWDELPERDSAGYKLTYYVEEVDVPGFESRIVALEPNYFEITNTFVFVPAPMNPAPQDPVEEEPDGEVFVEEDVVAVPKTADPAVEYILPLLLMLGVLAASVVCLRKN